MFTSFYMHILKVLSFMPQGDMCIWKRGRLICQQRKGWRKWSVASVLERFCGITQGFWCWPFVFTRFFFGKKIEPHFWWYGIYQTLRNHYWLWKWLSSCEYYISGATASECFELKIIRNILTNMIEQFTPHLCDFKEILWWGGNEDDEVGDIFYFISCWISKNVIIPKANNILKYPMDHE